MNFFEHQQQARKKTFYLLFLYSLSLFAIAVLIYCSIVAIIFFESDTRSSSIFGNYSGSHLYTVDFWNAPLFISTLFCTFSIIAVGSMTKMITLVRGGGKVVAEKLGGTLAQSNSIDPLVRRLLNVIEEMAIASGTAVPQVYVLENEPSINAFAAGFNANDAVIGVTRGTLNHLSRQELQGVIAHEYSHILNGDMRLNTRLMGILAGLLFLSDLGSIIARIDSGDPGERRSSSNSVVAIFGIILILLGSVGVFFSRIIKSAVSRQREFLADASAVQFTRDPDGLVSALKKIGGLQAKANLISKEAESASHMFFSSGLSLTALLATHPPLELRIKKIDPSFTGVFTKLEDEESIKKFYDATAHEFSKSLGVERERGLLVSGFDVVQNEGRLIPKVSTLKLNFYENAIPLVDNSIGKPNKLHLDYALMLTESLPDEITNAAHEPVHARALVYALVIVSEGNNSIGLNRFQQFINTLDFVTTSRFIGEMSKLGMEYRLPILEMCIPALKTLSKIQSDNFFGVIDKLVHGDGSMSLFEFALVRILKVRLESQSKSVLEFKPLSKLQCTDESRKLIELLSKTSSGEEQAVFESFDELNSILDKLSRCTLEFKGEIIESCLNIICNDGKTSLAEFELFRAIGVSLGLSLPPMPPISSTLTVNN